MPDGPHLYLRGATWWTNYTVAGEHIRLSTGQRDRGEAQEWALASFLEACRRARVAVPEERARAAPLATVAALYLADLDRRLKRGDVTRNTLYYRNQETPLRVRVVPRWAFAHQVTGKEWTRALADWHADGAGWSTLQRTTVATRALLRWAAEAGYIAEEPRLGAPSSESATVEAKERRPFTARERDAFLRAATKADPRMGRIYTVLFWTACRKSDLERLALRQVDLRRGYVRFPPRQTKSKKRDQEVWLHPRAAKAIRAELRERRTVDPAALVFGEFDFRHEFPRVLAAAGVKDASGLTAHHSTRHTTATLAADEGATLAELMALGRWSTPQMAARYMKVNAERSKGALKRL
jgi:integrase